MEFCSATSKGSALQHFITNSITAGSSANRMHIRIHGQFRSTSSKSPVLLCFTTDPITVAHPAPARHPKVQLSNVLLPTQLQWVLEQIACTFACMGNFVARHVLLHFITDSITVAHILPQHVIQKFSSPMFYY